MHNDTTVIANEELARLRRRDEWLSCLEQAGVDNWSGCDYATEIFEGEHDD